MLKLQKLLLDETIIDNSEAAENSLFMGKRMAKKKKKKLSGAAAINPQGYKGKMSYLNYMSPAQGAPYSYENSLKAYVQLNNSGGGPA